MTMAMAGEKGRRERVGKLKWSVVQRSQSSSKPVISLSAPRGIRPAPTLRLHVLLALRPPVTLVCRYFPPGSEMTSLNDFVGIKYKLSKSENFDEFMKAVGVGLVLRKMVSAVSPVVELSESGGTYTLTSASTFKTTTLTFRLDEEFEEETPDGRKVMSVVRADGPDTIVHTQRGDKLTTTTRRFTPHECTMTLTVDNVVCRRTYKKLD